MELSHLCLDVDFDINFLLAAKWLLPSKITSKVCVIGWKIATRVDLWKRGVIRDIHQQCGVLCFEGVVFRDNCQWAWLVFRGIVSWISWWGGIFFTFNALVKGKKKKANKICHVVWLATTWCIWYEQNNICSKKKWLIWWRW